MKNKKKNTIITIIGVGVVLLIGLVIFILNSNITDKGLSVLEKKWISDHTNQVVNVKVYNNVPVYGYNGSGINFDFLDDFTEKYHVSFNKVSYYSKEEEKNSDFGFMVLGANEKISDKDILFYQDHYGIMAIDAVNRIPISSVDKIGVLESEKELHEKYFSKNTEIVTYKEITDMIEALKNKSIVYVCLPINEYMDKMLENHLGIVAHLDDLKKNYVLRVQDELVLGIMKKSYATYLEKDYVTDYSKNYLDVYFNSTDSDDVSRKNYNSKEFRYGYVVNMPFENTVDDEFVGTISNYLENFENISYSEIVPVAYSSIDDLKAGLVSGEVDLALTNFDYQNLNMKHVTTNGVRDVNYYVLSKSDMVINSIKGIKDADVSVVEGSVLYQLCLESGVGVKKYSNTDELIRSIDDTSIVLVDAETYQYYKDTNFKDYNIVLRDSVSNGYRFILNEANGAFNQMFQFYVDSTSYQQFMYQYRTDIGMKNNYMVLKIALFLVALIIFLVITVWLMSHKNVTGTVASKDDKLKYIDPMTSLKNRNYLNKNIYTWDDNVIFPQGIIVFDLDHIKKVNDKFGREAGDEIIKQVAGILINQQLENTDIIRSDGDEFIIYMVGYEEKIVSEYMKKLLKLMRDIPKCLGVNAGYSMIYDEVKTVDDAINEAILMMMEKKETK